MMPRLPVAAATLLLAACGLPPERPVPPQARVTAPTGWREPTNALGQVETNWWRAFGDPALAALVEAALANNTDVAAALARVEEARAQIRLARSAALPQLNAVLSAQRGRTLQVTGPTTGTQIQPQLQVAWEADLFGRIRTLREAARLGLEASRADRDAVRLAVAAATAQGYVTLLSLDAQLFVTQETAQSRAEALRVASDRARLGYTSQLELAQAQAEYDAVLQAIPELERAVRLQENALRLLTGRMPGPIDGRNVIDQLQTPSVPGTLPSALLRRRPDLAAAELTLAALDAQLAARRAEFLPRVQLSAAAGQLLTNSLDYDPLSIWSLGASILAPLFSGGRLEAQVEAATAQRDQAAFAYRGAVLTAFGEVEDALTGIVRYGEQVEHAMRRRATLERALMLARDRYQAGYASYLEELDAQRNLYSTELEVITLRERQLNNVIDLYRALGGGWFPTTGKPQ
ncbi:efflux transporter outer membrane subunit [Pedomonas mirosovicensis]|uniref:efflux transporter outer membrane subunit n=1 Tax=Pedomonas mirosovicensis TaxID=2908641 RepID=UPI002169F729|nr:efflux transporter outer membrane subunit [Pedomonas mirosovicensis]MCH8686759.1 efflux transporter outer membrane subunit [Pedomonas mirosovicensis]